MSGVVYLNGEYLLHEQAVVSIWDRGFMFADGVYEVIPVYGEKLFELAAHLSRLGSSLSLIGIDNPHTEVEWREILECLVSLHHKGAAESLSLYIQVTRGVAESRTHDLKGLGPPTVLALCNEVLGGKLYRMGVRAVLADDIRWQWCHIKSIGLLPNVMLKHRALGSGATEALLIRDGYLTEGAASNVFIVSGGEVRTPPKSEGILLGVTRDVVLRLLRENGITVLETAIMREKVISAEEIWLTSSTHEIVAVIELDGKPVGGGVLGEVWRRVDRLYQRYKRAT